MNEMIIMYKFIIPKNECVNMYNYIHKMGYSAASLFPGYNGVAKEIHEKKILQEFTERLKKNRTYLKIH